MSAEVPFDNDILRSVLTASRVFAADARFYTSAKSPQLIRLLTRKTTNRVDQLRLARDNWQPGRPNSCERPVLKLSNVSSVDIKMPVDASCPSFSPSRSERAVESAPGCKRCRILVVDCLPEGHVRIVVSRNSFMVYAADQQTVPPRALLSPTKLAIVSM